MLSNRIQPQPSDINPNCENFSLFAVAVSGEGVMADGLLPIGTERAQKSSAMPSFTVLTPGAYNVFAVHVVHTPCSHHVYNYIYIPLSRL